MHVMLWEASNRFHRLLHGGSRNGRLPQLVALMLDAHRSLRLHEFAPERVTDAVAEHRTIYEAVTALDALRAEELARDHSRNALRAQLTIAQSSEWRFDSTPRLLDCGL